MAILFGTTAEGETLPVEVNEFGQLVAKGLPGEEGPQGPPGLPQLPPDPSEGDALVWNNGQLSWGSAGMSIASIQRGASTLQSNQYTQTVSISFVDPSKALVTNLGTTTGSPGAEGTPTDIAVTLDSGSRLLLTHATGAPLEGKVFWQVVEYT